MNESTAFLNHPYQWQESQWQHLIKMLNQDKLPHALLFEGNEGTGKFDFAQAFANRLICDSPENNFACGQCKRCQLLMAGSHPDFKILSPEEKSKIIKVDQVRNLVDFVNKKFECRSTTIEALATNPYKHASIASNIEGFCTKKRSGFALIKIKRVLRIEYGYLNKPSFSIIYNSHPSFFDNSIDLLCVSQEIQIRFVILNLELCV